VQLKGSEEFAGHGIGLVTVERGGKISLGEGLIKLISKKRGANVTAPRILEFTGY